MKDDGLAHEALTRVVAEDDCMVFAGRRLTDIANEVGSTPFYAYDREAMTERVRELRRYLPIGIHVHYAMKANPMPEVVRHFVGLVDGLDVASSGELEVALAAGADPEYISFAGPGKLGTELARALDAGITVNLESTNEMRVLSRLAEQQGKRARVAVRVNPDFELKSSGMKMAGGPKQFGVDAELVPGLLDELATLHLDFEGFHIFSGSQNLSSSAIAESQSKSIELAARLAEAAPGRVKTLNIGGGLGIPYFPKERSIDLQTVGDTLASEIARLPEILAEANIIIELGRFLTGEAGIYVCKVIDRKVSRGRTFLVVDGGLHHHLAASGNFGQVLRKNYPVLIGNRVEGARREVASVVGPLCTPLDLLADRMTMARADIGDLVVVLQSGAYGLTASPLRFLSHPEPREVLI